MSTKSIKHFYDNKYTNYIHPAPQTVLEKLYLKLKKYELHRSDAAAELLLPGTYFLDIGVGSGELLSKAAKKGYKKLYGIDVSSVVTKQCKDNLKKLKTKAEISIQNIDTGTNFKNNTFDTVTMIAVFEHIIDPHFVLEEINRILKTRGQLIIEVPNVAFLPRRISFLLGKLPKTADEPNYEDGHLQFYTQESIRKLLETHEFSINYMGCSGIAYRIRNYWSSLLGANIVISARKL